MDYAIKRSSFSSLEIAIRYPSFVSILEKALRVATPGGRIPHTSHPHRPKIIFPSCP